MILVADNLQILRPSVQRAAERRDPEPIADLVRRMAAAGAEAIDVNAGPCTRVPKGTAAFRVRAVEAACPLPVWIESVFLSMMAANGPSMALVDVFRTGTMKTAAACRALTSGRVYSWASLAPGAERRNRNGSA